MQSPLERVVAELRQRSAAPAARHHRPHGPRLPPRLNDPDLASVRVLSERAVGDRHAVALTVDDASGERYRIIRELIRDPAGDGSWKTCSGSEGPDRFIADKPDPYVSFYAYASDHFFAAGRVQDTSRNATRICLTWHDGYALEGEIENGTVLLFGTRNALEPATAEFLNAAGEIVGAHTTLIDER